MIPNAENPSAAALFKTAGAETSLRHIHGLTRRIILIEARSEADLEDLHDTARALERECAKLLSEAKQLGLSLRLRE